MNSDEYASLVTSARIIATSGGTSAQKVPANAYAPSADALTMHMITTISTKIIPAISAEFLFFIINSHLSL
jgi:hypothetical protein